MMNNELQHHGILGMKWGVRRYQPYPKDSKHKGKEIGQAAKVHQRDSSQSMSKKERKKQEELLRKAREEKIAKIQREADKQKALQSGNATEILKYKDELTYNELQEAYRRIDLDAKLRSLSKKEVEDSWSKINNVMKKVGNVNDWAKTGIDAYKNINSILEILDGRGNESTSQKKKKN